MELFKRYNWIFQSVSDQKQYSKFLNIFHFRNLISFNAILQIPQKCLCSEIIPNNLLSPRTSTPSISERLIHFHIPEKFTDNPGLTSPNVPSPYSIYPGNHPFTAPQSALGLSVRSSRFVTAEKWRPHQNRCPLCRYSSRLSSLSFHFPANFLSIFSPKSFL